MRDDLLDAQAAVDWGESQFPILSTRTRAWEHTSVETVIVDLNPQSGKKAVVAHAKEPLPAIINAEVGAIIGSFRSALDLLAASLALRNGVTPSHQTHFPIYRLLYDFIDPINGLENKKWLSLAEKKIIKSYDPYEGGNDDLWAIHQLDILRKHERLIDATVEPRILSVFGRGIEHAKGPLQQMRPLKEEPILFEFARDAPQPQTHFTVEITFNEIGLSVYRKPLLTTLSRFADLVREIIGRF